MLTSWDLAVGSARENDEMAVLVVDLEEELAERQVLCDIYEDYFAGRHQLAFSGAKFREVFASQIAAVSDNWMPLVVSATVERLRVQGFRTGEGAEADKSAWDRWQRNQLDADSGLLFTEASKHGEAALLVWPDTRPTTGVFGRLFSRRSQDVTARITVEHPAQVVVRREAGDRRRRSAALKRWIEDDGTLRANLFLPDRLLRFARDDENGSEWGPASGMEFEERHKIGVVPMVPIVNDPQMLGARPPQSLLEAPHRAPDVAIGLGRSDLADVISTQDQVNKTLCDAFVASEFGAFRQRWATGLEIPEDENGNAVEPFQAALDHLWTGPDGAHFGEFSQTDLSNYVKLLENRIQSIASRTRTPPHYLLGQSGSFPSGESLKSTETGLVAKVGGKQTSYSEGIEEAVAIAAFVEGDDAGANAYRSEVDWAQAESRSESEFVDSLVKKLSLRIPLRQIWSDAGYSAQQIDGFMDALEEQARLLPAAEPPAPAI